MDSEQHKTGENRRRHQRTAVRLYGRYMLADGREAKCRVIDISIGGIALSAAERGGIGESVVVYVDQIGRLEGTIVRHLDDGFALKLESSAHATARLSRHLEEIARALPPAPSPETSERPGSQTSQASVEKPPFRVVDVSVLGANLEMIGDATRPPLGTVVQVGKARGRVVEHTSTGVAIQFLGPEDER